MVKDNGGHVESLGADDPIRHDLAVLQHAYGAIATRTTATDLLKIKQSTARPRPESKRGKWAVEDEKRLLELRDSHGLPWSHIFELFPGRTLGAIQLRYYTMSPAINLEPMPIDAETSATNTVSADEPTFNRPLTPLSRCLRVGLPAETFRTAAGSLTQRELQNSDNSPAAEILLHAKVYCFAHRFLISDLESFALQRLTQVLLTVDTQKDSLFPYLADAIRFVYGSTPSTQLQDNPARKLLSQYVALKYTMLANEMFTQLLEEGGEFLTDLSQKLARRLTISEIGAQSLEEQIDELQIKVNELEVNSQEKESQLQRARDELAEWESWNRGISGKYKKAKRRVGHSTLHWDA
ncbi:hypothetical protein BBP40_007003 [Aspergillus hancockii]|nr:hypothetical protein BBP40_007003 [Aspergillus hancockii]